MLHPGFVTLIDDVEYEVAHTLEIDETQSHVLDSLIDEEEILLPPILFQKTSTYVEVRANLPIYSSVQSNFYLGSTNLIKVPINDHEDIDMPLEGCNEL